jgi:hypothetical protein
VVLSLLPLLLALLSGCGLKLPTHPTIRQAVNPCTVLGPARLVRLAHSQGTITKVPIAGYPQAQACRFRSDAGSRTIILGIFDSVDLSFAHQVSQAEGRFSASDVRRVRIPGATGAATMVARLHGIEVPVLMAMRHRFVYLALAVAQAPGAGVRLNREAMASLLHAAH